MATVTLTGTIRKAPGAIAWANAPYKIRLVEGFVVIGGATRPPFTLSGEASALGAVSVSLDVPDSGTAHYELSIPGGPWVAAYLSAADTPTVEGWMAGAYDTPADVETTGALLAAQTLGAHADVTTAGATDGQALVYDATLGLWLPGTVAGGGGGGISIVDNGDGTLTITGSSVTDNGDGTLTIG